MQTRSLLPLLFLLLLGGCAKEPVTESPSVTAVQPPNYLPGADDAAYEKYRTKAARIAAAMDDRLLAAQVIVTGLDGKNFLSPAMETMLSSIPAGGIMLFRYNLDAGKDEIRSFLAQASALVGEASGAAPFMAVDHEGGLVHRFGPGVEKLPAAFTFWDLARAEGSAPALENLGGKVLASALEIRELGITMNFAPVAEILNDDNLRFLETRSFGPDPVFTEAAAAAFIRGMDAEGIACVIKHFPGNTGEDPHGGPAVLNVDRAGLDAAAVPFAAIIRELRPPALMVSHVTVPARDAENPSSLSRAVMTDWLRGELGFRGIIIADDFSMAAVASRGIAPEDAAVEALIAGADMVMTWPSAIVPVHRAIAAALADGRLPRQRLLEAVERIAAEKLRYGLVRFDGEDDEAHDNN